MLSKSCKTTCAILPHEIQNATKDGKREILNAILFIHVNLLLKLKLSVLQIKKFVDLIY